MTRRPRLEVRARRNRWFFFTLCALLLGVAGPAGSVVQVFDVDETTSSFESGSIDVAFTAVLHPAGLWGDQVAHGTAVVQNVSYAADGSVVLDLTSSTVTLQDLHIEGDVDISGTGEMVWAGLLNLDFVYTIVSQALDLNAPVTVPISAGNFAAAPSFEFSGVSDGEVTGLINYGIGQQNFSGDGVMAVDGNVVSAGGVLDLDLQAAEMQVVMGGLPTVHVVVEDCALWLIGCFFYIQTADITITSFTYNDVVMSLQGSSPDLTGPVCGDGLLEAPEQCDDGNSVDGDGCSSLCVAEVCGDGIAQSGLGEQCDDGNTSGGDGCSATCLLEACGNGNLDPGEGCDDGNTSAGDGCSASCQLEVCGNGALDPGEECDDGNTADGDGCSATCADEVAPPVPALEAWSALLLGLLVLAAGTLWLRRSAPSRL